MLVKTALHQAVIDERLHQVRLLLAKTVDLNVQDVNGRTPLMLACSVNHGPTALKMVRLFLDRGALINCQDRMGRTALMMACLTDKLEIAIKLLADDEIELMVQDTDGNNALMHAATMQNSKLVSLILNQMAIFKLDVDLRNSLGYTALLLACQHGCYESAFILLTDGKACPYLRDYECKFNAKDWLNNYSHHKKKRFHSVLPPVMHIRSLTLLEPVMHTNTPYRPLTTGICMNRSKTDMPSTMKDMDSLASDDMRIQLLKALTKLEQETMITTESGFRVSSKRRQRKREVSTALLRQYVPQGNKIMELRHIFKLYALEYLDEPYQTVDVNKPLTDDQPLQE